jgi:hypothetical protein
VLSEVAAYRLINFWNDADGNWKYVVAAEIIPFSEYIKETDPRWLVEFNISYIPLKGN